MKKEELLAVLRLQITPKIGSILAKKLINITGSASQVFKENNKKNLTILKKTTSNIYTFYKTIIHKI